MLVTCKANSGQALSQASIASGNFMSSQFTVTIGRSYVVVGMIFWRSTLNVLISDDYDSPNTFPIELFEVSDGSIPNWWRFGVFKDEEFQAAFGYKELFDITYWNLLIGKRDQAAIDSFREETRKLLAAYAP